LSWLPVHAGYAFIGVKRDGTKVDCLIERTPDGHRIFGAKLEELVGWLFKSKPKEKPR
jgi:hypothetical protein